MSIDFPGALKSYAAVVQAGRDVERQKEGREELRLAASQRGADTTQVTLSREALQAQVSEQVQKRERVNGNDRSSAVREADSSSAARQAPTEPRRETSSVPGNAGEAIAAYRSASRL